MYAFLIRLLAPLILGLLILETFKRHGGWRFFLQRLGWGYPPLKQPVRWIHCASVGEVSSIEGLVNALPEETFLITTNTPTGSDRITQLFGDKVYQAYLPFDWPYAIKHFLKAYQPISLWVVETEIWPNLYCLTAQQGIPITLINARLSKKTLKAPVWLQTAYQQALSHVQSLLARDESEANRFKTLGIKANTIQIIGNLKYAGLAKLPNETPPLKQAYLLLASSHANEEIQITQAWLKLGRKEVLVIVPRHFKRGKAILKSLEALKKQEALSFSVQLTSQQPIQNQTTEAQILIDDTMGQLMAWFAYAKLVVMGGSFVPAGGHNVLEPAAVSAAIITGPDMSDFIPETQLLKTHQGIVQVKDMTRLCQQLSLLLDDESARHTLGKNAKASIQTQAHILDNYIQALIK